MGREGEEEWVGVADGGLGTPASLPAGRVGDDGIGRVYYESYTQTDRQRPRRRLDEREWIMTSEWRGYTMMLRHICLTEVLLLLMYVHSRYVPEEKKRRPLRATTTTADGIMS